MAKIVSTEVWKWQAATRLSHVTAYINNSNFKNAPPKHSLMKIVNEYTHVRLFISGIKHQASGADTSLLPIPYKYVKQRQNNIYGLQQLCLTVFSHLRYRKMYLESVPAARIYI